MKKTFVAVLAMTGLAMGAAAGLAQAAEAAKEYKAVYHLNSDDIKHHKAFLGNVQNHINAVGKDKLDLRVVMHGPGLAILQNAKTDNDIQSKIDNLKLQGVSFNVCANTLKSKNIDKKDLYDVSDKDIVPSGVAELAILQSKGYAYVKP
jgi:intracellular sulfur oxidation DsrE/DsrF family protein